MDGDVLQMEDGSHDISISRAPAFGRQIRCFVSESTNHRGGFRVEGCFRVEVVYIIFIRRHGITNICGIFEEGQVSGTDETYHIWK